MSLRWGAAVGAGLLALLPGIVVAQPGVQGFPYAAAYSDLVLISTTGADEREPFADGSDPVVAPGGGRIAYWSEGSLHVAPLAGDGPVVSTVTQGRPRGWRSDGAVLVLEHPDGTVELIADDPAQAAAPFPGSQPRYPLAGLSLLLVRDGALVVREPYGGEFVPDLGGVVEAAAWTAGGEVVIARLADGTVVHHDLTNGMGRPLGVAPGAQLLPSPDGRILALLDDLRLRFVDTVSGELLREVTGEFPFEGTTPGLTGVWLPDARQLEVQLWISDDSGCHCAATFGFAYAPEPGEVGTLVGGFQGRTFSPPPQFSFFPPPPGQVLRHEGPTRFETAAAVSASTFATAALAVVAPHDRYAEALVGAAATRGEGPLLLSTPDGLHPAAAAEVQRLAPREVLVVGDEEALGAAVLADLRALGVEPERVGSLDGTVFGIAAALAERSTSRHAYLVEGAHPDPQRGWPDALAVSGLAAATGDPVLLTLHGELPEATRDALAGYETVTIVGGTSSVSAQVQDAVEALGITVDRLAGASRWETSEAVAAHQVALGADEREVVVATGDNWPDAVAAGPAAATLDRRWSCPTAAPRGWPRAPARGWTAPLTSPR